jgi:hypothetical protein
MARRKEVVNHAGDLQPDELNELKAVVEEFVKRLSVVDQEMEGLKEDRKGLIDEYSSKIDVRTLNAVMKIVKIKKGCFHKDTFDMFMEILEND